MDSHGYTGVNVVSPAEGTTGFPEVLSLATAGQIDPDVVTESDAQAVKDLLNGVRQAKLGSDAHTEAYSILLKAYCSFWNEALPFMFDRRGGYLELLIPDNILAESSVLKKATQVLTTETCEDVEVIGWLYQFYIAERKDEVYAGFKKKKKAGADEIPPATQLFTPHWIVRYLAENSIGRLWLLNFPNSSLKSEMKYYIDPVDEPTDFLKISGPEDIKIIDPACGSGHMLTYAFDLLYAMYQERGYSASQIPSLILENNLFGTEIDERAGSLAAFALAMKAASKRRLFLKRPVVPSICVLKPISFTEDEIKTLLTSDGDHAAEVKFWNLFEKADLFGSLLRPDVELTERLAAHVAELSVDPDIFVAGCLDRAHQVIEQAQYLARTYEVVIGNPPYLGNSNMSTELSAFMKREYPTVMRDLYGAFLVRGMEISRKGLMAMIVSDSWMSLSNYEQLRYSIVDSRNIISLLHLRDSGNLPSNFGSNAALIVDTSTMDRRSIPFIHLAAPGPWAKGAELEMVLNAKDSDKGFYLTEIENIKNVPGMPLTAYRLTEKLSTVFARGSQLKEVAAVKHGMATGKNEAVVRQWWEPSLCRLGLGFDSRDDAMESGCAWFPYNSGGKFRKWYGNMTKILRYDNKGQELMASFRGHRHDGRDWYFSPSISWSDITSSESAFRFYPSGFVFGNKGNSIFASSHIQILALSVLNSTVTNALLGAIAPTITTNLGEVGKIPMPIDLTEESDSHICEQLISTAKSDWDSMETSWCFSRNPVIVVAERLGS